MKRLLSRIYHYNNKITRILLAHLLPILFAILVLPLAILSYVISSEITSTAQRNADHLSAALGLKAKVNDLLPMLLIQDDATKAILIDPAMLEKFSERKISAYDKHQQILKEIYDNSVDKNVKDLITNLRKVDTEKLRPIDSKILETVFEDLDKARNIYFEDYSPRRDQYEKLVKDLYQATMKQADDLTNEIKIGNSSMGFRIQFILLIGLIGISVIITFLGRLLRRAQDNINILLGSLREGLFFFNREGQISSERAVATEKIVPGSNKVDDLISLFKLINVDTRNIQVTLGLLWENPNSDFFSDFATSVSMLPRDTKWSLGGEERNLQFEYRPQFKDGLLDRVVVVVSDITEKLRLERDAANQAERVRKLAKAAANMRSFIDFSGEIGELVKISKNCFSKSGFRREPRTLKRTLHTLKGTLAIFDFSSLSKLIHSLETMLDEPELDVSDETIVSNWKQIQERWGKESEEVHEILGLERLRTKLILAISVYDMYFEKAKNEKNLEVVKALAGVRCLPILEIFSKYENYLVSICERKGNKSVAFSFEKESDNLAFEEIRSIDGMLTHIFTNCVDHGLEEAARRVAIGKNPTGNIYISAHRKKDRILQLIVKDDGAGIDYEKLASKAVARGLWSQEKSALANIQEKINLIFEPGISTAEKISETSGRGVGMDVVKSTLESLGGKIVVHSEPGVGTRFEIDLPLESPWDLLVK